MYAIRSYYETETETEIQEPVIERRQQEELFQQVKPRYKSTVNELSVTITDIKSPAYLINHNFEIEWINKPAENLIFDRDIKAIVDISSRNIFRLLLHDRLKDNEQNWKEILLLHLTVHQAGEVRRAFAGDPVLLQRHAAAVLRGDIEEAGGVGREQPFIGGHGHEIWLHLLHVERQGTTALCQVQHQRGADIPAALVV